MGDRSGRFTSAGAFATAGRGGQCSNTAGIVLGPQIRADATGHRPPAPPPGHPRRSIPLVEILVPTDTRLASGELCQQASVSNSVPGWYSRSSAAGVALRSSFPVLDHRWFPRECLKGSGSRSDCSALAWLLRLAAQWDSATTPEPSRWRWTVERDIAVAGTAPLPQLRQPGNCCSPAGARAPPPVTPCDLSRSSRPVQRRLIRRGGNRPSSGRMSATPGAAVWAADPPGSAQPRLGLTITAPPAAQPGFDGGVALRAAALPGRCAARRLATVLRDSSASEASLLVESCVLPRSARSDEGAGGKSGGNGCRPPAAGRLLRCSLQRLQTLIRSAR